MRNKKLLTVAMIIAILAAAVGGTIAFLVDSTQPVQNTFTPEQVTCEIVETFNGHTKSVITVKNTCDIPVFIRVALVSNWRDENRNVAAIGSSSLDFTLGTNWQKIDDYYYYMKPVMPGESTSNLLGTSITLVTDAEGNKQAVTVLAEAIQAQGVNANGVAVVTDVWGVPTTNN